MQTRPSFLPIIRPRPRLNFLLSLLLLFPPWVADPTMPDFEFPTGEPSDHKTIIVANEKEDESLASAEIASHRSRSSLRAHSWHFPSKTKWRVMAACMQCFGNGVNDSGGCNSSLQLTS